MSKAELIKQVVALVNAKNTPPMQLRKTVEELLSEHERLGEAYDRHYGENIGRFDAFIRTIAGKRKGDS